MAVKSQHVFKKPIILAVLGFLFLSTKAQEVAIIYEDDKAIGVQCSSCSKVSVRLSGASTTVLGHFVGDEQAFYPTLPFDPSLTYELWDHERMISSFKPDAGERQSTQIVGIFPKDSLLPANLLKMHLAFSAPMSFGDSYQYIHFFQEGREVYPLLDLQPELWNEDRTVLTLWLDPGRIKRDLLRQKQMGTPLEIHRDYQMSIDATWRDQSGRPISRGAQKQFYTVEADREVLSSNRWDISFPEDDQDSLTITFDEPMDYLLLLHAIHVIKGDKAVSGKKLVTNNQHEWHFWPDDVWSVEASYQLVVESRLEDLAGNNLSRPFDRNVDNKAVESSADLIVEFQLEQHE